MSQEDVEVVRAAVRGIEHRDYRRAAALFAPSAEWHNTSVFPGQRVCVGVDSIIGFWEALHEDFELAHGEIERLADADGRGDGLGGGAQRRWTRSWRGVGRRLRSRCTLLSSMAESASTPLSGSFPTSIATTP